MSNPYKSPQTKGPYDSFDWVELLQLIVGVILWIIFFPIISFVLLMCNAFNRILYDSEIVFLVVGNLCWFSLFWLIIWRFAAGSY